MSEPQRCGERPAPDPAVFEAPAHGGREPALQFGCPMHPEIESAAPGKCPLCGMSLEATTAEQAPKSELADMTRRVWMGGLFTLPLMVLAMGGHSRLLDVGRYVSHHTLDLVQFALATPVVFWAGWPLLVNAWASVRNRSLNMFSLVGLGVGAAYVESVVALFAARAYPAAFAGTGRLPPVYFESAAVITVLVLLGQVLELRARARTGNALRALMGLAPKLAQRVRDGESDEQVSLDEVRVGDRIRVRPGERVPIDGIVLQGQSAVDESMISGESMPIEKTPSAWVIGGTMNGTGSLIVRAERVGSDTLLANIVQMVAAAQRSRAPIQRLADRISAWFVPAVIMAAVLTFLAWMIWGPAPAFPFALTAAVCVLIIACPCALGLATPMSIMVGVGRGATAGILIKNAEALERLEKIDTLIVDKTGTLTEGKPRVVDVTPASGFDERMVLQMTASLEQSSEHPFAAAIVAASRQRDVDLHEVSDFRAITGLGITGAMGGRTIAVGNARLLSELGISMSGLEHREEELRRDGASTLFVAIDKRAAAVIAIADPIKPTTRTAIRRLRAQGVRIMMLTGDNPSTAQAVAEQLGIVEFEAQVLPERKSRIVLKLRAQGHVVAVAGDGVNDAPALAAADVGLAMGTGADVAVQSAGVTLVNGDLSAIARARALSRATMRNIRQNLSLAFCYNVLGIPLAAGVLYPIFGVLLSPTIAAAAMSLSSVSVIVNALRLQLKDFRDA